MAQYRRIDVTDLFIDPSYQREEKPQHVKKIADDWDEAQLGVLEVSEREDGYAVFDGQHRLKAAETRGEANLPCLVHTGLTPQEEAELFRQLQDNRKALTPLDRFKARHFAEDPVAVGIFKLAEKHKYKVGTGPKSIQSIVAFERVYLRGNLDESLNILGMWRGDAKQLEGSLIDGLSRFLLLYPEADRGRAREQWAEFSPTVILRRSAEFMATAHSSKAAGVLEVLRDLYTSRKFPLPTVEKAVAERKAVEQAGRRTYRRVQASEVRDAMRDLCTANGSCTVDSIQEHLGTSRASLTKRGGFIDQVLDTGSFRRVRDGGQGKWRFEIVPVSEQSKVIEARRTRSRGQADGRPDETARSRNRNGGPVPYTGRPEIRSGSGQLQQRQKAERGKRIVQK